jgi:RHH-type proline utilization regulon transcriptional repressor/proline dehydrogenase/delta 1-pyrroline-5-carboxylate dehydrogenase
VVEHDRVGAGCRFYAPVGQHEDLLAYLVRRLLENGANSSFVNRIQDDTLPVDELIADPVQHVRALPRVPHPRIPRPREIYGPKRTNAQGVDLTDRVELQGLKAGMEDALAKSWRADPIVAGQASDGQDARQVHKPHDRASLLGATSEATDQQIEQALATAAKAARGWVDMGVDKRAQCLERAAELMEARMTRLLGLLVAEVGKTLNDAVAEVREAIDFCRYYAMKAREDLSGEMRLRAPIGRDDKIRLDGGGVFLCISPWNLPFAIFNGQVTAALVAGNAVLAKPAEQSPLIAGEAVRLLHVAGVPGEVLHLLPGDGRRVGGALTADPRVTGVCFTGSTETARAINRALSKRDGPIPPLIAETGGQNAMIVDSTALTEQVARDVVVSAFQNAGQRCSALRVLYVQEDVAERTMDMIAGAMEELTVSDPQLISTDVGPVIDDDAQSMLNSHIKRMLGEATEIKRAKLGPATENGSFVTPAAFEIDGIARLQREVFGPILHVVRYQADRLNRVVEQINATGYGLTMGIHSRIDEMWKQVYDKARVGNTYVNRNQIGAIVGVQPFGGQGLSGTGPKAGGPLYLQRFVAERPVNGAGGGAGGDGAGSDGAGGHGDGSATALSQKLVSRKALSRAFDTVETRGAEWLERPEVRAEILERAADALEAGAKPLKGVAAAGEGEAKRSADFLRVYAAQVEAEFAQPMQLPGPTGERNELSFWPKGLVSCIALDGQRGLGALIAQAGAALAAGNTALLWQPDKGAAVAVAKVFQDAGVPDWAVQALEPGQDAPLSDAVASPRIDAVAFAGELSTAREAAAALAETDGPIRPLVLFRESPEPAEASVGHGQPVASSLHYLHRFVHERSLSIDTTASGGNASLLSIEDELPK